MEDPLRPPIGMSVSEDTSDALWITIALGLLALFYYWRISQKENAIGNRETPEAARERRAEAMAARLRTLDTTTKAPQNSSKTTKAPEEFHKAPTRVSTQDVSDPDECLTSASTRHKLTKAPMESTSTTAKSNGEKVADATSQREKEPSITPTDESTLALPTPAGRESNKPSLPSPSKKTRFYKNPPPAQIVCESLTWIFQAWGFEWTVETNEEANTWGGSGWWTSVKIFAASSATKVQRIRLPLHKYYVPEQEQDFQIVCQLVQKMMDLPSNESDDDNKPTVEAFVSISTLFKSRQKPSKIGDLLQIYARAETILTGRSNLFLTAGSDWHAPFARFIGKPIQQVSIAILLEWIRPHVAPASSVQVTDGSHEEEDDLFTEDYNLNSSDSPVISTKQPATPWNEFLAILTDKESAKLPLKQILDDLFSQEPLLCDHLVNSALADNWDGFDRWIGFISQNFHPLVKSWTNHLERELGLLSSRSSSGRQSEIGLLLAPVFRRAAPTLDSISVDRSRWGKDLSALKNFPTSIFQHPLPAEEQHVFHQYRQQQHQARQTGESCLKLGLKADKHAVFQWIKLLLSKSLPLSSLAKSELLDREPSSKAMNAPSHALLLGVLGCWIQLCGQSLDDRFVASSLQAFEVDFFVDDQNNGLFDDKVDYPLFGGARQPLEGTKKTFTGSSNFFFLGCYLFRMALHSGVKMEHEFYQANRQSIEAIRASTKRDSVEGRLPQQFLDQMKPVVATWLGWKVFFEDHQFVARSTNFSLLQLEWVLSVARSNTQTFLPDWMVKDPARWLAEVAHRVPHLLNPLQAQRAVECCTELLGVGHGKFSPIVVTCLFRIALAFVKASVNRAKHRVQRRRNNKLGHESAIDAEERDLDIYTSFDKTDLGVTVFTNTLVSTQLCPMLIRTFKALDMAQVDVDIEYDYDKFRAKTEVADLLIWLWSHPNGECRMSAVKAVTADDWRGFAVSCTSALSVYLDDAVQKVVTTIQTKKQKHRTQRDERFIGFHSSSAAGGLVGARRLLLLLCMLSEEDNIASGLGGREESYSSRDLSNCIVHFLDILTTEEGGTHPDLELSQIKPTLEESRAFVPGAHNNLLKQIRESRDFLLFEIGLDVSILCHQLLALAAKWHACTRNRDGKSPLLQSFSLHPDLDISRYHSIYKRLVVPWINRAENEKVGDATFFYRDGYTPLAPKEETKDLSSDSQGRRRQALRDQMSHEAIQKKLHGSSLIPQFLDDLKNNRVEGPKIEADAATIKLEEIEDRILSSDPEVDDSVYTSRLSDFVVSSHPFLSQRAPSLFLHFYDSTARACSTTVSSKMMVKEARKCSKTLPDPHPNSSCFVCFAEERMDLCRAVVTGPVGTPYSMGLFVFDIFFPREYPRVPPLLSFMTTGGGQVRFNPNLYVDGKVCLSLLGLAFAKDDSQRWKVGESSLAQILLSIQSQIFGVEEPYFNEGSGIPLQQKDTPAGRAGSRKHNSVLRLATLRHAVLSHLKSPPLGFEDAAKRHFSLCRARLVIQMKRWVVEEEELAQKSGSFTIYSRFQKVYREILGLLAALETEEPRLRPLQEDLSYLKSAGVDIVGQLDSRKMDSVPGEIQADKSDAQSANPWAGSGYRGDIEQTIDADENSIDEELYE